MTEEKELMTEQEFIAKFKENGFDLYKTESLKPKLKAYNEIRDIIIK